MRLVPKRLTAVICSLLLISSIALPPAAEQAQPQSEGSGQAAPKISNDQLDSLVAPIALYPDPVLAQVLAASTYPIELIELEQWLAQHKELKDQALVDAVKGQDWDPSVQGLAGLPDVVKRLTDDIKWTTDLGNAFLAQQSDVMDAVQRMRAKAKAKGNLESSKQMNVETQTVQDKQVIVIQQSDPQVVYVPDYNPTVVYGAPAYPYPPVSYPPPGYYAAGMALSFGVGMAMGAMMSGGWGYNCGWHGGGDNNITVNRNNNFNRNSNLQGGNRVNGGAGNQWQHNPAHRGGAPYSNQAVANRYGGTTRGSSQAARQSSARQSIGQEKARGQQFGGPSRSGAGGESSFGREGSGGGGQGSFGGGAGGGERVGNRSASMGGSESRGGGGFGGGGFNSSGAGSRASSSRGSSSMGGGGFGSGGFHGGGGRRR
jgi:hypothetical protein